MTAIQQTIVEHPEVKVFEIATLSELELDITYRWFRNKTVENTIKAYRFRFHELPGTIYVLDNNHYIRIEDES